MSISGDFNSIIPIAALYAFAGYRLMPALQQIYGAISQLRFVRPSLDTLKDDIKGLSNNYTNNNQEILNFKKTINLKNINFSYPNTSEKVLKNINFTIPALSTIGLVGETGSGKTTIIDIILGLLDPVEGKLEIDNTEINKLNKRSWQNIIGYVPQNIYLADDSVAANIAFGVEPKKIDQGKIEKAAKIANLHNFIINELPNKYQTEVGERGVRLSGGQ